MKNTASSLPFFLNEVTKTTEIPLGGQYVSPYFLVPLRYSFHLDEATPLLKIGDSVRSYEKIAEQKGLAPAVFTPYAGEVMGYKSIQLSDQKMSQACLFKTGGHIFQKQATDAEIVESREEILNKLGQVGLTYQGDDFQQRFLRDKDQWENATLVINGLSQLPILDAKMTLLDHNALKAISVLQKICQHKRVVIMIPHGYKFPNKWAEGTVSKQKQGYGDPELIYWQKGWLRKKVKILDQSMLEQKKVILIEPAFLQALYRAYYQQKPETGYYSIIYDLIEQKHWVNFFIRGQRWSDIVERLYSDSKQRPYISENPFDQSQFTNQWSGVVDHYVPEFYILSEKDKEKFSL